MHLLLTGFTASKEKIADYAEFNLLEKCGKKRQMGMVEELLRQTRHNPGLGMLPKIMNPWTALPSRASQSDPPNQLAESVLHLRQTQSCAELRNKEAVVFALGKDLVA
jgi:hypothetical protein